METSTDISREGQGGQAFCDRIRMPEAVLNWIMHEVVRVKQKLV
jgi:hypothetical protein